MKATTSSGHSKEILGNPLVPVPPGPFSPMLADTSRNDLRWSEMVPPNSALTFAIILSDDDDPISFSGAELLRTRNSTDRTKSIDGPWDVSDGQSQILSVLARSSTNPLSTIEPQTATLAYFREAYGDLFGDAPLTEGLNLNFMDNLSRPLGTRTQTSSTLDGLDVYLRGSMLGKVHGENRHYSCFDGLDTDFVFDHRTSFDNRFAQVYSDSRKPDGIHKPATTQAKGEVVDEGFSETPLINARPRVLTRATSKSSANTAYCDPSKLRRPSNPVASSNTSRMSPSTARSPQLPPIVLSEEDWRWSAIGVPTDPEALSSLRFTTQTEAQRRRLRKSPSGFTGRSTPTPPSETALMTPSELNHRQMTQPSRPPGRRSIPAAPDIVLRRDFYNHQLPSVRESELMVHETPEGHWSVPKRTSTKGASSNRSKSTLPFSGIPLATSVAPKVVKRMNSTYKSLKSSVHPEKDGWVYVDVQTEIKVKQKNV